MLSICRALDRHELLLVTGGEPVAFKLPQHVKEIRLPSLMMDEKFQALHHPSVKDSVDEVKARRTDILWHLFKNEAPDLFLVELYPFGRKAFRFELDPVLEGINNGNLPHCRIVCSVRDILVEKAKAATHEKRALDILNRLFDVILIHADPKVITLDQTFGPFKKINIPIVYTGYVTDSLVDTLPFSPRRELKLAPHTKLVVVSVGGGKVGEPLLRALAEAYDYLPQNRQICFLIFTGPFADKALVAELWEKASDNFRVHQFTTDFQAYLKYADLSVSMAGYNTCVNILAAKISALVFPFQQNREQGMRAKRLSELGALSVLAPEDLDPSSLARIIVAELDRPIRPYPKIDINGAKKTAGWIEQWMDNKT
jgi:predicted glycosyltransferase